jgi:hypothetical protein
VQPSFDGWYKSGQWVAIQVDLTNSGSGTSVEVRTNAGTSATYSAPVELPTGAQKRVPLYVRPSSERLQLNITTGGKRLDQRAVNLRQVTDEQLVAVVADQPASLGGFDRLASGRGRSINVRPEDLPEQALALGSLNLIILAGGDVSRMSEAQQTALYQWVALGGELVVTGGPASMGTLGSLPERLRPATATGTHQIDGFAPLSAFAGKVVPAGGVTVADLQPVPDATVVAATYGHPLIVRRDVGEGVVMALALDLEPFVGLVGLDNLWSVLAVARPASVWDSPGPTSGALATAIGSLPQLRLPPVDWTVALIVIYILIVGPLNYLFLRRRRRLDLAWVTIPGLTLAASVTIYGAGYMVHGSNLTAYELSTVRLVPGTDVARVWTTVALFSPASRGYDVSLAGALAYPVDNSSGMPLTTGALDVVEGAGNGVRDFEIDQWAIGGFAADAVVTWPGGTAGGLAFDGQLVKGTVRNPFGRTVSDAMVMAPGTRQPLGVLDAGKEQPVSFQLQPGSQFTVDFRRSPQPTAQLRAGIFADAFQKGLGSSQGYYQGYYQQGPSDSSVQINLRDAYLVGWASQPPLAMAVAGWPGATQVTETLLYARLPLGDAVPFGYITGQPQTAAAKGNPCGTAGVIYDGTDAAYDGVFDFERNVAPGQSASRVDLSVTERLGSPMDWVPFTVNYWDWGAQAGQGAPDGQRASGWQSVGDLTNGQDLPLPSAAQTIRGTTAVVRLKIEPESEQQLGSQVVCGQLELAWRASSASSPDSPNTQAGYPGPATGSR